MTVLERPLYQRHEGADQDQWRLMFDTRSKRLFVAHQQTRGDMRGAGYCLGVDELEIAAFLREKGPAQDELMRLLTGLFEEAAALSGEACSGT